MNPKVYSLENSLDELELKLRHINLLLNYYADPPKRFDDDWNIWWAKEVKPENDFSKKVVL